MMRGAFHHGQHRQRPQIFLVVVTASSGFASSGTYGIQYFCAEDFRCKCVPRLWLYFFHLKPARDEFKFKIEAVTDDVDFQLKYDAKEYGRINIDYSTEEAKELARKEFMGDPFAKVKLKSEFTNTINLFKQKLLG